MIKSGYVDLSRVDSLEFVYLCQGKLYFYNALIYDVQAY